MKNWRIEIDNMIKQSLKEKDMLKANVYRMLKTDLTNAEIENARKELTEEQANAVIMKSAKKRKDTIEEFKKAGRMDRAEEEEKEFQILSHFLPEQIDEKELEKIVKETIKEINAESIKDMGKVMGHVMGKIKGKADGKMVQELVKKNLS